MKTVGFKTFEILYIDYVAPSLDHCLFHCKYICTCINLTNHLTSISVKCTVVSSSSSSSSINVSGSSVGHFLTCYSK